MIVVLLGLFFAFHFDLIVMNFKVIFVEFFIWADFS